MKLVIATLVLAGCWASSEDYPPGPPEILHGTVGRGGGNMTGRVCVLVDPRSLTGCEANAGGLTVSIGTTTTTTAADGSFQIPVPAGTNLAFTISGESIVPTNVGFSSSTVLPVLSNQLYNQMLASVGFAPTPPNGGILSFVSRAGEPLSNVTVTPTPSGATGPFFDGSTALTWNGISTGLAGAAWLPGQTPGPTALRFTDLTDNSEQLVDGVQVVDGGITMVSTAFP